MELKKQQEQEKMRGLNSGALSRVFSGIFNKSESKSKREHDEEIDPVL